jgi:hypothetical protein
MEQRQHVRIAALSDDIVRTAVSVLASLAHQFSFTITTAIANLGPSDAAFAFHFLVVERRKKLYHLQNVA